MTHKTLIKAGVVLAAMAVTSAASAATLTLENFTGAWQNVVGGANVNNNGSTANDPRVNWGVSLGSGQSGYRMDLAPVNDPPYVLEVPITKEVNPPPVVDPFRIGRFTHFNQPISGGTSISSVELLIAFDLLIDDVLIGNKEFTFLFSHWETDNFAQPCADGGDNGEGVNINGCADRVQISALNIEDVFTVDGVKYTFDLVGFSNDENCENITSEFWTIEQKDNGACLFAQIRAATPTPEPGSLALLGLGLLGLGVSRRKAS